MPASLASRDLSDLIGQIYDAALDPAKWEPTLERIKDVLDCQHAFLHLDDFRTKQAVIAKSVGIAQPWLERQAKMMPEVTGIIMRVLDSGHPLDEPSVASFVLTPAQLAQSPYAQEWGRPQGLVDYMDLFLIHTPTRLARLEVARHESHGNITQSEVEIARLLIPHLRRAVTISNVLDAKTVLAANLSDALDALKVAIILTDAGGRILHSNPTAEAILAVNGPLRRIDGILSARSARANSEINVAIALASGRTEMKKVGLAVRLDDDDQPMMAHILPLMAARSRPQDQAVAAVFISATSDEAASARAIAATYGLTTAETRVLEEMLSGKTIAELAGQLGVTTATARTHLSHIFAKTGVQRQSALLRLAATMAPIVR